MRAPLSGATPPAMNASRDLAPLQRRLGLLQLLRFAMAAAATIIAFALPGALSEGPAVAGLSAMYAVVSGTVEVARRRFEVRRTILVIGLVLFDGAYLAAVMALTGGPQSVLAFLVLTHVIGITLLLSFRYGLKAGLWHTLLLFVSSWLQQAGVVNEGPATSPGQAAALGALALLGVAVAAAGFSSLNEGELRRGKAELHALAEMGARMAGTLAPAGLAHALLLGVDEAFRSPRVAVVLREGPSGQGQAFRLLPDGSLADVVTGPATRGLDAAPAAEPSLVRVLGLGHDPLLSAALPDAANVVVAPLVVDGQSLGTLAVERGGGPNVRLTARTVELIAQFAAHGALALRAAALRAEVERLADTDALTALPNRRVFEAALVHELAVAARRGEPCALILLDVDHFKAVNDTYGHQSGDEVLRLVGRALAEAAREADLPARYGGEEFVVVVPGCSAGAATAVAERLRAAVADASASGPVPVTVSAGVAAYPLDATESAALVAAADSALYRAKRLGRDRSVRFRRARVARRRALRQLAA